LLLGNTPDSITILPELPIKAKLNTIPKRLTWFLDLLVWVETPVDLKLEIGYPIFDRD